MDPLSSLMESLIQRFKEGKPLNQSQVHIQSQIGLLLSKVPESKRLMQSQVRSVLSNKHNPTSTENPNFACLLKGLVSLARTHRDFIDRQNKLNLKSVLRKIRVCITRNLMSLFKEIKISDMSVSNSQSFAENKLHNLKDSYCWKRFLLRLTGIAEKKAEVFEPKLQEIISYLARVLGASYKVVNAVVLEDLDYNTANENSGMFQTIPGKTVCLSEVYSKSNQIPALISQFLSLSKSSALPEELSLDFSLTDASKLLSRTFIEYLKEPFTSYLTYYIYTSQSLCLSKSFSANPAIQGLCATICIKNTEYILKAARVKDLIKEHSLYVLDSCFIDSSIQVRPLVIYIQTFLELKELKKVYFANNPQLRLYESLFPDSSVSVDLKYSYVIIKEKFSLESGTFSSHCLVQLSPISPHEPARALFCSWSSCLAPRVHKRNRKHRSSCLNLNKLCSFHTSMKKTLKLKLPEPLNKANIVENARKYISKVYKNRGNLSKKAMLEKIKTLKVQKTIEMTITRELKMIKDPPPKLFFTYVERIENGTPIMRLNKTRAFRDKIAKYVLCQSYNEFSRARPKLRPVSVPRQVSGSTQSFRSHKTPKKAFSPYFENKIISSKRRTRIMK